MERVLVTGANGFVGRHLVKELADNNFEVMAVGGPQRAEASQQHINTYLTLDLTSPEAARQIDFKTIGSVIHLAGLAAVGPSFDDPTLYMTTNVGIETNLFEAAQAQDAHPRFLVVSSGALYDPTAPLPLTEKSSVIPSSPYAVSKLGQEQMGQYYNLRGFEVISARPFNHIGPGQNPGFIVPDLTQQVVAVEKGESDKVLVGNLDAKRDFTDVRDIVRAYRLLIEKGRAGEIYNICSGVARDGHEMLDLILKHSTAQPRVEQDAGKMRPADNPVIYGSHDKLTADTGWQPSIAIETTIQAVIEDWRNR